MSIDSQLFYWKMHSRGGSLIRTKNGRFQPILASARHLDQLRHDQPGFLIKPKLKAGGFPPADLLSFLSIH